jgi:hypothetical protein
MERSTYVVIILILCCFIVGVTQIISPTVTAFDPAKDCQVLKAADISPSSSPAARQGPPQPRLLYPSDGESFSHFPRHTVLVWERVQEATSYSLEIDCYHCCEVKKWCSEVGRQWRVVTGLDTTFYAFGFVGAQPGRWRVWAIASNGEAGPKSVWRQFRYTK